MLKRKIINIFIIIIALLLLIIFNLENMKLWNDGLRYQLHSFEYSLKCMDLNEDICFKINKADLEKNKVIYQKNGSVLKVDKISKVGEDYNSLFYNGRLL